MKNISNYLRYLGAINQHLIEYVVIAISKDLLLNIIAALIEKNIQLNNFFNYNDIIYK